MQGIIAMLQQQAMHVFDAHSEVLMRAMDATPCPQVMRIFAMHSAILQVRGSGAISSCSVGGMSGELLAIGSKNVHMPSTHALRSNFIFIQDPLNRNILKDDSKEHRCKRLYKKKPQRIITYAAVLLINGYLRISPSLVALRCLPKMVSKNSIYRNNIQKGRC